MLRLSDKDRQQINLLLMPSWLSGLVAIVIAAGVTIGIIVAFSVSSSDVQQQLLAWQHPKPQPALTTPDQTLPQSDKPTLSGSWPLVIVWSLIGLAVYLIAASITRSAGQILALRKSLEYVNARPGTILEATAERLALRLIALAILASLIYVFVNHVLPYSILAANASSGDVFSLGALLYGLMSFTVIVVSLHLQTIFLRLTLGRVRVFTST